MNDIAQKSKPDDGERWIHVHFRCDHENCNRPQEDSAEGWIKPYQLGLVAIWFHSFHEGHKFSYWEDGELILGKG